MHCAKGKTHCIPLGAIDGNATDAPPTVKKVLKPAHPSSRPARAAKSAQVDYMLPPVPRPTKKSKKVAGKQKEVSVAIEAEEVQGVAPSAMQQRSLFADIDSGRGISVLFLLFSLMMNKLLDGETFLVDMVDKIQGVVERHTMQINDMMLSFYDINSCIDLVDGVANGARVVIMGFAGTLDAYGLRVDKLAKRLEIAEEKIREQAEKLARHMDTVPAVQHMMTAIQTEDAQAEDALASNAVQHESSAVQTEVAQVVFVSPVQSGLLAQKCRTETGTGSPLF